MSQVNTSLEESDPEIFDIVEREKHRQVRDAAVASLSHEPARSRQNSRDGCCALLLLLLLLLLAECSCAVCG